MSRFRYRAVNAAGEAVAGEFEAASPAALEQRLRAAGLWLHEATAAAGGGARRAGRRVPRAELISFFVELSLLLRARITLPAALERLAEDFAGARLGGVLRHLHAEVNSGVALHQAMAARPRVFSAQVVAMVQAGEISGQLAEVFASLAGHLQWLDQLVSDVRQALIYPLVVTVATLGLIVGLFTLVVPRFLELLQGLALHTPLLTRAVMAVSEGLVRGWPVLALGAAGLPLALRGLRRIEPAACACDRALLRLPVFGSLIAMFGLSRFTHNLGMLYRSGVPLLRGLEICRHLVGNRALAAALDEVRRGVAEGAPLSRCLARHAFFPASLVTMIASGETSGSLAFSLQSVSDYYDQIIPRRIKLIFALVNPLIMVLLIAVVGAVALAVVLPILQLWQVR